MTLSEKQSTTSGSSCPMFSQSVYQSEFLAQNQCGVWLALASRPSSWLPRMPGTVYTKKHYVRVHVVTQLPPSFVPITMGDISLHSEEAVP